MHEPQVIVQNFPVEAGIFPVADAYNGDPDTDVISLKNAEGANFLLFEGAGGTGTTGGGNAGSNSVFGSTTAAGGGGGGFNDATEPTAVVVV